MTPRVPTAVLISGRGSNLRALLAAAGDPSYPAEIKLVVSNRADAAGLDIASEYAVEARVVDAREHSGRESHEAAIDRLLRARGIELVALAGYMRILSPWLVTRWAGRMVNIHPSLLPQLRGLHTHRRALDAGATAHGCSVHLVTDGLDEGPVLAREEVAVLANDTEQDLAARVLDAEHRLYPRTLAKLATEVRKASELARSPAQRCGP